MVLATEAPAARRSRTGTAFFARKPHLRTFPAHLPCVQKNNGHKHTILLTHRLSLCPLGRRAVAATNASNETNAKKNGGKLRKQNLLTRDSAVVKIDGRNKKRNAKSIY